MDKGTAIEVVSMSFDSIVFHSSSIGTVVVVLNLATDKWPKVFVLTFYFLQRLPSPINLSMLINISFVIPPFCTYLYILKERMISLHSVRIEFSCILLFNS